MNDWHLQGLSDEDTAFVTDHAAHIRALAARSAQDIIEIGQRLTAIKDRLPHGTFGPWLEREFGWSNRTAQKFMQIHRTFGESAPEGVFDFKALELLSASTTPIEVRERFVNQAKAGKPVHHNEVRQAVSQVRRTEPAMLTTVTVRPHDRPSHPPAPWDPKPFPHGDAVERKGKTLSVRVVSRTAQPFEADSPVTTSYVQQTSGTQAYDTIAKNMVSIQTLLRLDPETMAATLPDDRSVDILLGQADEAAQWFARLHAALEARASGLLPAIE
ncbi:MAG: DUF3102 domain-containing protein [Chloroflexota bacterium]|nr:DUF3102 domain-containing protein [Chloroflexota bacterium]